MQKCPCNCHEDAKIFMLNFLEQNYPLNFKIEVKVSITVNFLGKGAKMRTNYYARSSQRKEEFPVSIMGMKNENRCNLGKSVNFDRL